MIPPYGRPLALVALGGSALAFATAPLVLAESYRWIEHTTSESGAQGVDGAWLARTGFVLFGLAVIWIGHLRRHEWRQPATAFHVAFGICMFGVAAYSLRSWETNATYDPTEDLLHSIAATVMGFAFAFGVTTAALRLKPEGIRFRFLDAVAVASSVILPISMSLNGSIDGALQRAMFFIAYLWYGREALLASDQPGVDEFQAGVDVSSIQAP